MNIGIIRCHLLFYVVHGFDHLRLSDGFAEIVYICCVFFVRGCCHTQGYQGVSSALLSRLNQQRLWPIFFCAPLHHGDGGEQ